MQDLFTMLSSLRRPRLLIRAARLGAAEYRRSCHLPRLIGYRTLPGPAAALVQLIEMEREMNAQRKSDDAGYSLPRHLDVLIALVGEAQLYQASRAST
jgi:hypothetical protein